MDIYYIARGLGATSRGIGILKALGTGVLVTAWREAADAEEVPWFGTVPLRADVLIWDGVAPRERFKCSRRIVVGPWEGDADLILEPEVPILPRLPVRDLTDVETWWQSPPAYQATVEGRRVTVIPEVDPAAPRVLGVRGGNFHSARLFKRDNPGLRYALPGPDFHWSAIDLMALADEVVGGGQSQREFNAVRGSLPTDGAAWAAAQIRKILEG